MRYFKFIIEPYPVKEVFTYYQEIENVCEEVLKNYQDEFCAEVGGFFAEEIAAHEGEKDWEWFYLNLSARVIEIEKEEFEFNTKGA